tara:strand:- start:1431 stop:6353 length:4923 start_codon:yes stop_codon:yes gene_type:complete
MSEYLNTGGFGESLPDLDLEAVPFDYSDTPAGTEPVLDQAEVQQVYEQAEVDHAFGTNLEEESQAQWDMYEWAEGNSIVQTFGPILREVFAEPVGNFLQGFRRGGAELGIGAYELARDIADNTPDMEPAAREDFIKKVMDEVKTWEAYDGDDAEAQFMDKVFYHLGHAAPGMLAAVGVTMAAGVAVPAIATGVGLGALARYGITIGNAFRFSLGTGGKFLTTFGAGSTVSIFQEYANALAEGREPEPLAAFMADAGFNAGFSSVLHFTKHLPIKPMWQMLTAAAVGGGITKAAGATNEEAAANAILFALMQGGQIRMSSDKDAPGAVTQAYRNIMNWVNSRKARDRTYSVRDYFKEFKPVTFSKDFYPDGFNMALNDVSINPNNELSIWDAWLRTMEENYNLGSVERIQPHTLPELIFNEWKDRGAVTEKDRPNVQSIIKAEVDAILETNKLWQQDYYERNGVHYQPKSIVENPRYLEGVPDRDWDLAPKEKIDITDKATLRSKVAVRTYVGKDGSTKTRELKLYELSQEEAIRLFADEPGDIGGITADADIVRMLHRKAVEERLDLVAKSETYKNRVPLIALKAYKDDLGKRYSYLYAKKDATLTDVYAAEDGFDVFFRQNMTLDEFRSMAYDAYSDAWTNSQKRLLEIREKQNKGYLKRAAEGMYRGFVGASGLLDYRWREKGYDELADAFHMSYGASSKTQYDWHLFDRDTNINNWEPEYLKDVSGLYRALALREHKARVSNRGGKFETQLTMAELRGLAEHIQLRAKSDETPWSLEQIIGDVKALKSMFDQSLEYAMENGMVSERGYGQIEGRTWMPLRRMIDLEKRIMHLGNEADKANSKQVLQYLQKAEQDDTQFDIRHLLHGQISRVNNAVAKNRILQAAARVGEKYPDQLEIVINPDKIKGWEETGSHVPYEYIDGGKSKRVYLTADQAKLLNAGVFKEVANRNDGLEVAARMFRIASGAGIRQQLVSADPSFGASMIIPDMMHIITTHPEFHTNSFNSGWFDLYKLSAEYQFGSKTGDHRVRPFFYNVVSVLRKGKDGEYKDFLDHGGTALSLARAEMDQGMLDTARRALENTSKRGKLKYAADTTLKLYGKWVEIAAGLEMGARLTEYQMLRARGSSGERAAAKVTERLNYGRSGVWTNGARKFLPFLNAGIQSTDAVVKMAVQNPKAVAKMIPQLMLGYGAIRAINEAIAPGADMDRPLEERIRTTMIFGGEGLGATQKQVGGGRDIHYGLIVKDALHPVAALSKLLTIVVYDYHYQKQRPGEYPEGPEFMEDKLLAAYSVIAASAPVELQGFIPPAAQILEIYRNNTLMLGDRPIFKNEGQVSRADEINYRYEGATRDTSNMAIDFARHMQIILPDHVPLASPARLEAATTQLTPSNTLVDIAKYPFKVLADNSTYAGDENFWKRMDELYPFINRHIGRTYPEYAQKEKNFIARDAQLHNYESKVMKPIRPKMAEVFNLYLHGVKTGTDTLPQGIKAIEQMAKTLVNDGEWPTSYGDTYKASAVLVMKNFISTMVTHYKIDKYIQEADKTLKDTPFENATDAIGSIGEWRDQFGPRRTAVDKAEFIFGKWKYLTEGLEGAPAKYKKTINNYFKEQYKLLAITEKNRKDGTLNILTKLINDYNREKGNQ